MYHKNQRNVNQLTVRNEITYSYDANGNLTHIDSTPTHTWDRANRLLSYGGSEYAYNGLGQRVSQEVDSVVTQYLLDTQPGLFKVLQADNGTDIQRYVHDQRGILSHQDNEGDWNWMVSDGLGSVRGVYDETLGQVYTVDFDPYGNVIDYMGSNPTPFGYPGEWTDENGLVYLRARYYDPALGGFFNLDPLETGNRYGYASGNPVNFVDITGYIAETPSDFIGTCQQLDTSPCSVTEFDFIRDNFAEFLRLAEHWNWYYDINGNRVRTFARRSKT